MKTTVCSLFSLRLIVDDCRSTAVAAPILSTVCATPRSRCRQAALALCSPGDFRCPQGPAQPGGSGYSNIAGKIKAALSGLNIFESARPDNLELARRTSTFLDASLNAPYPKVKAVEEPLEKSRPQRAGFLLTSAGYQDPTTAPPCTTPGASSTGLIRTTSRATVHTMIAATMSKIASTTNSGL